MIRYDSDTNKVVFLLQNLYVNNLMNDKILLREPSSDV